MLNKILLFWLIAISSTIALSADCEPRTKTMYDGLTTILTTCSKTVFNSKLFTDKDRKKVVSIFDEVSEKMPKSAAVQGHIFHDRSV